MHPLELPNFAFLQGQVEQQRQAFIEAAWGPLLSLLRQDARQAVPPNLQSDKAARQGIKDKWTAVNKALGEAQAQQVRGWGGGTRRGQGWGGGGRVWDALVAGTCEK